MDLLETTVNLKRHPWELARVLALKSIIALYVDIENIINVLDVGCGDAFSTSHLFSKKIHVDAIDINLTQIHKDNLSKKFKNIYFYNKYESLTNRNYKLILLLDVLEHIKNDKLFLHKIHERYLKNDGYLLITAPAFNVVFGAHDSFLGHYRRYTIPEVHSLVQSVDLHFIGSGYLFFSLLIIRMLQNWHQNLTYKKKDHQKKSDVKGLGSWNFGIFITEFIKLWLIMENWFLINLSKIGIKIPGLSIWVLCKK